MTGWTGRHIVVTAEVPSPSRTSNTLSIVISRDQIPLHSPSRSVLQPEHQHPVSIGTHTTSFSRLNTASAMGVNPRSFSQFGSAPPSSTRPRTRAARTYLHTLRSSKAHSLLFKRGVFFLKLEDAGLERVEVELLCLSDL